MVQAGAGVQSRILNQEFADAGAAIGKTAQETLKDADVVLKVRRPESGALVVGIMDPYGHEAAIKALAEAGVTAFAMEMMPRITRAQVMDDLSSQANLAGHQAVIDAAANYGRAIPMMMTAAGTVPAARIFVMGAGVDGLEEIVGAILTPDTLDRAWAAGIRPRDTLADNDGHGFFGALRDAVVYRADFDERQRFPGRDRP